ncbi:MAG: hypothetical protein JW839_14595 [Candidatus Lokiarchaeota archaeon]|nr:hypothetical protein [Candidatus Lokiarchaeota archaeon]
MNNRDKSFTIFFACFIAALIIIVVALLSSLPLEETRNMLETTSYVVIIFSIPVGLLEYYNNNKRERRDREYGTYDALNQKYADFQMFCFEHPYLDIFDVKDEHPKELDETQQKEEMIAFIMLYKIFERAFLMYRDQSSEIKKKQWKGWDAYIRDYLARPNFQRHLNKIIGQYDVDFDKYILGIVRGLGIPFVLEDWQAYLEEE